MDALFNQLPDCIRNKIIVYYLGFGTPVSNLLRHHVQTIRTIKEYSTQCTDDFTLWRWKIAKTQENVMNVKSRTFSGYIALCELTIAYNQSDICDAGEFVRNQRIFHCEKAIRAYGITATLI